MMKSTGRLELKLLLKMHFQATFKSHSTVNCTVAYMYVLGADCPVIRTRESRG